ncbi:venom acid phosphatase Acph-1-like [Microplitis demolitor]|uniref:venom acid phosphatase Acph-1-like n=1 Tax=Microplitis demolitor TaxID=69319 RepID=UPI00235B7069|nr:venom acid phosphatase Acph-1-like [Microplitis demolitor]
MLLRKNLFFIFIIYILLILNICDGEIKLIQATIRHADRNPIDGSISHLYYPNDPYKDRDWYPDGPMELTNKGKQNAYKLGKLLREKYKELFGEIYKPSLVYFKSIGMNRAINTAHIVAAGLFPPSPSQVWNPDLPWIPIPVHSLPTEEDILNFPMLSCENYAIDRKKSVAEVDRLLQVLGGVKDFFSYLTLHTGVNHTRAIQSWILYHQLASQASLGLDLAPWITEIFPNGKLVDISAVEYILQTYTDRMKRLLGGIWIKMFLDQIDDLLSGKNTERKGFFYASNEIQIAAILNTLKVYEPHVPGYASTVIFEFHQIDSQYYVKVVYINEDKIINFFIPGCESTTCLLTTFKTILKNVTMEDFDKDCGRRGNFTIIDL